MHTNLQAIENFKYFSEAHSSSKNSEKNQCYFWWKNALLWIFFRILGANMRLELNKAEKTRF